MRVLLIASILAALPSVAIAQTEPFLVSPDGTYLGDINSNRYDSNSISNPYGQYGSRYNPDSVNNPYGEYGSRYSDKSPNNPYATNPPIVIGPCIGYCPNGN